MQRYELLISGGILIDPVQGIHDRRDVAFRNGRVAAVEPQIGNERAASHIDATGKLVVPGLVDAHVHVFEGVSHYGINPD